ncbi:MAG: thermonuclease family protein [Smithellaceae bacterium]|nr:thermonuclease family protein [Smithellaceae bacterium]
MVVRVSDGDTITVETREGTKIKVRLYGIDAPETDKKDHRTGKHLRPGQPFGDEAHHYLSVLIEGKTVRLEILEIDRYRRMVSVVWLDGRNINLEMIMAGLAEAYTEYLTQKPLRQRFLHSQEEARERRLGIWSQGGSYERPGDFRKRQKM